MGRKQKKNATQRKNISQKTCTTENVEDEIGIEFFSCDSLSYACNGEDSENQSESKVMDLEAVLKIKVEAQQRLFNEMEFIYKDMISRMNG